MLRGADVIDVSIVLWRGRGEIDISTLWTILRHLYIYPRPFSLALYPHGVNKFVLIMKGP
jgi:hypothetical protein